MNSTMIPEPSIGETPDDESEVEEYPPSLLAFGPADHAFEAEGSEDSEAYILGYN
jgi:hypothetical protein